MEAPGQILAFMSILLILDSYLCSQDRAYNLCITFFFSSLKTHERLEMTSQLKNVIVVGGSYVGRVSST